MLKIGDAYWHYWKSKDPNGPSRSLPSPTPNTQRLSSEKERWTRLMRFGDEFRYYRIVSNREAAQD